MAKLWATLFKNESKKRPFQVAPIIESPPDRGINRDYRRPTDPEHIIRVNQKAPKGLPKKLHHYIKVAGISQPDAQHNAIQFIQGTDRAISLKREPDNPVDSNAVLVIGNWRIGPDTYSGKLGYLPKGMGAALLQQDPSFRFGCTLDAMFVPHQGKGAGVRISIWGPRARKKKDQCQT
jgi:hypothetical protein